MSTFVALKQFDLTAIDLNFYDRNYLSGTLQKNANVTFAGTTYTDFYEIHAKDGPVDRVLRIYGTGLTVSPQHAITAGTINAIAEADFGAQNVTWYAQGLILSAFHTFPVVTTPSNSDDRSHLLGSAFGENDTVTLSPFNDTMSGFWGDDLVTGGAGDDVLDGDNGNDTAVYEGTMASAEIARQGNAVLVTVPGEGTDILTNFEFLRFANVTFNIEDLAGPPDVAPPEIVSFSPANDSIAFPTSNIVVKYDEPILFHGGIIQLRTGSPEGPIVETIATGESNRATISGSNLNIDFATTFAEGTTYYVTMTTGTVADLSHNNAIGIGDYSFTVIPPPDDWTLYTANGFVGEIGGSGQVVGTAGFQDIRVLDRAGTVSFDGSFNKGGDVVRLSGAASSWDVCVFGAGAVLTDGDTSLFIPLGTVGMAVAFADGVRSLRYDEATQTARIGNQTFGTALVSITAPADGSAVPSGADANAQATLYFAPGEEVAIGGKVAINGTAGDETVEVTYGNIVLDGSFNKGGDILDIGRDDSDFVGSVFGSQFVINTNSAPATQVSIPVGEEGMDIVFDGAPRTLIYDPDMLQLLLGSQIIPLTGSVPLGPSA